MDRNELNFVLKQNGYLNGGTKEACVKVREFLQYATNPGNQLQSPMSCVTADEFMEAVMVIMAYTFRQEDQIPERWHCDSDCKRTSDIFCPGECNISKSARNQCPFFMDEGLI